MNLPADASNDQTNCPPGYYRRNTGMMHQLPETVTSDKDTLSASDMARLKDKTHDELITFIRTLTGALGMIPLGLLSQDELKACTRLRLAELAINCKDDKTALAAIGQLLDRLEGKPLQSVDLNQKVGIVAIVMEAAKLRKDDTLLIDSASVL